jgi:hypothetical protein
LSSNENIKKELQQLQQVTEKQTAIDSKLDELVGLLSNSEIDSRKIKQLKQRVNQALDQVEATKNHHMSTIDTQTAGDAENRAQLLNEFSVLLASHPVDSRMSKKFLRVERFSKLFLVLISVLLILLGFAMIVMPAPPYFEMFTIFYFNPEDGVTLMDVISLLIILSGIYLLVKSINKTTSLV